MRPSVLAVLAASAFAAAVPAAAQDGGLGASTATPEEILHEINPNADAEELQRLIAAAASFPLGSVDNPIRVGGPEGATTYLARLRCADGSAPRIGNRSDAGVGAFGTVTSAWPAACGGTTRLVIFDLYHEGHVEDRAPTGFSVAN